MDGRLANLEHVRDLQEGLPVLAHARSGRGPLGRHDAGLTADAADSAGVLEPGQGVVADGVDTELREDGNDAEQGSPHGVIVSISG